MRNIKLIVEYDGTLYAGWQYQKNAISIQQRIMEAIEALTGEAAEVIGSSRTDAGVHAKGFTANFKTESKIPSLNFKDALNSKLPKDIVVISSEEVPLSFHSRYDCKGKTYSYTILNRLQPPAIGRNYVYHFKDALDVPNMQKACTYFIGTHDFSAFRNTGSSVKTSTRTISELYIETADDIIKIYVTADGFLYNMVRIISGTLVDVGTGKIQPEEIERIIASKDRSNAGKSAPPCGLCLEKVYY